MTTVEEQNELRDRILHGLKLTYQRLLEEKKRTNSELIIMKDGKIVRVKPEMTSFSS